MPYEKKKATIPVRSVEGRTTFGALLMEHHGEHLERIVKVFDEHPVPGVNTLREELTALLGEELTHSEAYRLGMLHEEVGGKLRAYRRLLENKEALAEYGVGRALKDVLAFLAHVRKKIKG